MEAVRRLRAGVSAPVVAADLGVAVNIVSTWGKLTRPGGRKALKAVPKSGRPVKLAKEHWTTLRRMILGARRPAASTASCGRCR